MKLKQTLLAIVAAAILAAGCEKKEQLQEVKKETGYSSYSQFGREPEMVVRNGFNELILLHDFDGDKRFDMEECCGGTPGSYVCQITPYALERHLKIRLVSPVHFDGYDFKILHEKDKEN